MIIRKKPTYVVLSNLYDVIREIYKDKKYYYTPKELENKIIIEKGKVKNDLWEITQHSNRTKSPKGSI